MKINLTKSELIYKQVFIVITILYTTALTTLKGVSTVINFLLLLWAIVLLYMFYVKNKSIAIHKSKILLLIFMCIYILTIIKNPSKASNIKIYVLTFMQFFVLYSFNSWGDKEDIIKQGKLLMNTYVLASAVPSLITFAMYILNITFTIGDSVFGRLVYGGFNGIYTGGNTAALVAALSIMMSAILILMTKGYGKVFYILSVVLQVGVLLSSKGRAGILAVGIFFIAFILIYEKSIKNKVLYIFFLLTLGFLALWTKALFINKPSSLLVKNEELGFFSGRLNLWSTGLKVIKENFLIGVGTDNVTKSMKEAARVSLPGIDGGGLHNIFFQIGVANGVIASIIILIFFVFVTVKIYSYISKNPLMRYERIFVSGILAFSISIYAINMVEANIIFVANFVATVYWTFMGNAMRMVYKRYEVKVHALG